MWAQARIPMEVILSGSAELPPSVACGVDDGVVVFEDGV